MAQNQKEGLLIQSSHKFFIDITPGEEKPTWTRLAKGFNSFDPQMNENIAQDNYLDGGGLGTSTVMGGQLTVAFEGHRYYGDPAQDWIFSKFIKIGNERETRMRWEQPDDTTLEGPITVAVTGGPSGEAAGKGEVSVEIHFNGTPEETTGSDTP
ncbi:MULTISPECIES: phage tail tube protein [Bacillus amyloliquefaciens group]|nr:MULTISPECIES: hypothetical protein [Bacillus amyloliquefaciens group]APA05055.1 capsid protein [Bacillus velezensis]